MKLCLGSILLAVFLMSFGFLNAQKQYDNNWILSQYIHLQFDSNEIKSDILQHENLGYVTGPFQTAISDLGGGLLFHTSGCFVMDKSSHIMDGGDSLSSKVLEYGYCSIGDSPWWQSIIVLPSPGNDSEFSLFTLDMAAPFPFKDTMYVPVVPLHMLQHIIDMDANGGQGSVVQKGLIAIEDTLSGGYIQACKHANGRDWWVVVPEWNSNCYYAALLTPQGLSAPIKSCGGPVVGDLSYGAEVAFSPDGNWYARSFAWVDGDSGRVELYRFDRCTGTISYYSSLHFPIEFPFYTGLAFSPNSSYLYVSSYKSLWQYDLLQHDVQNSVFKVAELEGPITNQKGSLYFEQLAPNGEIIISSPGNRHYLSAIQKPNNAGPECQFKAHKYELPDNITNWFGLPSYPNYRLGPIDGSICDSLGINNEPIAKFRYEIIPGTDYDLTFTNLSYFEPDTFRWDFGDLSESDIENPVHHFDGSDIYSVCLTARNKYGSNTVCQDISLISTWNNDIGLYDSIEVYPNPTNKEINIILPGFTEKSVQLRICDMFGTTVLEQKTNSNHTVLRVADFPSGLYFVYITDQYGAIQGVRSVVKIE